MRAALLMLTAALSGCVVNSARPYERDAAAPSRAVVVYGITVAGAWNYPAFGVTLDHYDIQRQSITGSCFTFDRLEAGMSATPAQTRYFAFDAPAGHYVYSGFMTAEFAGRDQAFEAPPGRAVYIGNFVLGGNATVTLRRELDASVRQAVVGDVPALAGRPLEAARPVKAAPGRMFLCAP